MGDWGRSGIDWLREELKKANSKVLLPRYWDVGEFGKSNPNNPIVGVSWYEACAYAEWLCQNWERQPEVRVNPALKPQAIRLPLETEWTIAAGGEKPDRRYPWDEAGKTTTSLKEILRRANISDSGIWHTTLVNAYPLGRSPFGVLDMAGNVWEWQANVYSKEADCMGLRGGSWHHNRDVACVSARKYNPPSIPWYHFGFRVVAFSSLR